MRTYFIARALKEMTGKMKMTEREIIKGLECCYTGYSCKDCPYYCGNEDCPELVIKDALDLINRQKAEIERLEEMYDSSVSSERNVVDNIGYEKSEAIKEFAERLKEKATSTFYEEHMYVDTEDIDNLVKEMTEEE